jgi:DNA-binding transcriptional ArsR family regulator
MTGRQRKSAVPEAAGPSDELDPLWKALADPTRRAILDLLRQRPRTTGELAEAFPTSRFAVMKHLGVLSRAGLVVSRRRWRERWNHLNAVPLEQLYERWVKPYESAWASGLVQLKRRVEGPDHGGSMAKAETQLGTAEVELEIAIDAPRARVWQALVADIGVWWRKDFLGARARAFILEPRPGGRLYEDWGDGEGRVWYTVLSVEAPGKLQMAGHFMPGDCGGSYGTSHLCLELLERGESTVLRLSDSIVGRLRSDMTSDLTAGWQTLFGEGLKPHAEKMAR